MHDNHCLVDSFSKGADTMTRTFKVYSLVHIIPFLLFKRKQLRQNPAKSLTKLLKGIVRSNLLIFGYLGMFRAVLCLNHKLFGQLRGILS